MEGPPDGGRNNRNFAKWWKVLRKVLGLLAFEALGALLRLLLEYLISLL